MAKNERNVEGPFLARSKGGLNYAGAIPDYGKVGGGSQPVESNRSINTPTGTKRGNVRHVGR